MYFYDDFYVNDDLYDTADRNLNLKKYEPNSKVYNMKTYRNKRQQIYKYNHSIHFESGRCILDDDIPLHRYRYKFIL